MKKISIFCVFLFIFVLYLNNIVWAKYEIDKKYVAATLQIDRTSPTAEVTYKKKQQENQTVEVTIKANEIIQQVQGWTLEENQKTLKKEYLQNQQEEIQIEDLAGNKTMVKINIENNTKTN